MFENLKILKLKNSRVASINIWTLFKTHQLLSNWILQRLVLFATFFQFLAKYLLFTDFIILLYLLSFLYWMRWN